MNLYIGLLKSLEFSLRKLFTRTRTHNDACRQQYQYVTAVVINSRGSVKLFPAPYIFG